MLTMAVRTFTKPSSLDARVAVAVTNGKPLTNGNCNGTMSQPNGVPRSEEAAKDSQQSHSKETREPLANHTNPKSKPGITFSSQDKLPALPIPDLEATCQRYLSSLSPLQTPKEHHDSQIAVKEFLRAEGPRLQEKLKDYAAGKANYIEQFCTFDPWILGWSWREADLGTLPANHVRVRLISQLRQSRRSQPQPLFPSRR
jgi:carnitine O-acetyltransferase